MELLKEAGIKEYKFKMNNTPFNLLYARQIMGDRELNIMHFADPGGSLRLG